MTSVTLPAQTSAEGHLRALSILRDLPQVADLIELCFSATMDEDGKSYLQQMRSASRDNSFLRWAGSVVDSASLPLSGFVWEENGRIVGNVSTVPHNYKGRKITLIANVATHPDYRRRGIGRALTERAMEGARQKGARELWLQVRDDNPTAVKIYLDLGFVERARRTTYSARPDPLLPRSAEGVTLRGMSPRFWPLQREWLYWAHPDELSWYAHWDWDMLGPGLWKWFHRAFVEFDVRQWAACRDGEPLATLSWVGNVRPYEALWAAAGPNGDAAGLRSRRNAGG